MENSTPAIEDGRIRESKAPISSLLQLPGEVILRIMDLMDDWCLSLTLRDIRLTCKQLSQLVAPTLFRKVRLVTHLYFLERLAHDIKGSFALREYIQELVLDTHSAVNAAAMFIDAHEVHGIVPGLIETRYVQPERTEIVRQQETEELLAVFRSLKQLQSITVALEENHNVPPPDHYPGSKALDVIYEKLDIPDWSVYDEYVRVNWHFETPSVLVSILYALDEHPQLKNVKFRPFNLVRLGCRPTTTGDSIASMMFKVISKLEHVSVTFQAHDDSGFEFDSEFESFTDGPGSLLRRLDECTSLKLAFYAHRNTHSFGKGFVHLHTNKPWPIMPKLRSLELKDVICKPEDLLKIMTIYYPHLKSVALWNVTIVGWSSAKERHEFWTDFLKRLKARIQLESLWFCGLFNPQKVSQVPPRKRDAGGAPELYARTIAWFHDYFVGDDECPLNSYEQATELRQFFCHRYTEHGTCYGRHVPESLTKPLPKDE